MQIMQHAIQPDLLAGVVDATVRALIGDVDPPVHIAYVSILHMY